MRLPALRMLALAMAGAALLAGCAEFPSSSVPGPEFPVRYRISVTTDATQRHFTARLENRGPHDVPNVAFTVALIDQILDPPVEIRGEKSGLIPPGETRTVTVSFGRGLEYRCYGWILDAGNGHKEEWDNCR